MLTAATLTVTAVLVPNGGLATEEPFHGTAAALLAAGHPWDLAQLQYTTFCGGCTAESLFILPWFWVFGPRVLVWKAMTILIVLAQIAAWALVGRRVAGPAAARLVAWTLALAPTFFRVGGRVSFGSHFEVMVLVALALIAVDLHVRRGGLGPAVTVGGVLGAIHAFSYTGDLILPVVVLAAAWASWRRGMRSLVREGAALLLGAGVGLMPWILTQHALGDHSGLGPEGHLLYGDRGLGIVGGTDAIALRWQSLGLDGALGGLFFPTFERQTGLLGGATLLVALAAVVRTARLGWARRGHVGRTPWELLVVGALGTYLGMYLAFAPVLTVGIEGGLVGNAMRYLLPFVPLLAVCLATAVVDLGARGGRLGLLGTIGVGAILGPGGTAALIDLSGAKPTLRAWSLSLPQIEPWDDVRRIVSLQPTPSGPFWLDDPAEADAPPRLRHVLQAHARASGRVLAESLTRREGVGPLAALGDALGTADEADVYALAEGLTGGFGVQACGLPWEDHGVAGPWSRGERPWPPEAHEAEAALATMLGALDTRGVKILFRACFDAARPALEGAAEALARGGAHPGLDWWSTAPPGPVVDAFAVSLGRAAVLRLRAEREPGRVWQGTGVVLEAVPSSSRHHVARGMGIAAGERWGDGTVLAEFLSSFPKGFSADATEGARAGVERTSVDLPSF